MKRIIIVLAALVLASCVSNYLKSDGEYVWKNKKLNSQRDRGEITEKDVKYKFVIAKNKCKIESLKVPIPSPSCTQAVQQDCSGKSGIALSICEGSNTVTSPDCNYSSVNAAYAAQKEIFSSCMVLNGWEKIWVPNGSVTEPKHVSTKQ